jgi:hypothetical protein
MGTKLLPGEFDCYHNAEADEPMFVLLARDASAPTMVRLWAETRRLAINIGRKPESDRAMVDEAYKCADAMEEWRKKNRDGTFIVGEDLRSDPDAAP